MPLATEVLRQEHEAILQMLDAMDAASERLVDGRAPAPEALEDLCEFFRTFADRCHHAKEEGVLFPALEARGIPRQGGPVGVMLLEHDLGRRHVAALREAAAAHRAGKLAAVELWRSAAADYGALLRDHIDKENEVLFPMAEEVLGADELGAMAADFERVERDVGEGVHARMHALMGRVRSALRPRVTA